jgi:hypothetical protein
MRVVLLLLLASCSGEVRPEAPKADVSAPDSSEPPVVVDDDKSFVDAGWDGPRPQPCQCPQDTAEEIVLEGDGPTQYLRAAHPISQHFAQCTPRGPAYDESSCTGRRLAACTTPGTMKGCLSLRDGYGLPEYIDRDGISWALNYITIDAADAAVDGPITGTLEATANRGGKTMPLTGTFRACFARRTVDQPCRP